MRTWSTNSTVEAGVASLYHAAFGRTGEAGGVGFWFDHATEGLSLHDIALKTGGSVKWTNDSQVGHTVTFTDSFRIPTDNGTFNKKVDLGASVSRTFPTAGTYLFFCQIHAGMQGTITVGP